MRDLAGKTAFVTGGASGIGLALGRAFAEAGMTYWRAPHAPRTGWHAVYPIAPLAAQTICLLTPYGS
jgi:NAD(P)-dependent dehydrogenase (short-subunit alcohol dehydrogenase family)